jgi:hypothetical protein
LKPPTELGLLNALKLVWPEVSANRVKTNSCILATRIGLEVGQYFGFSWRALPVDLAAFNDTGFAAFEAGIPVADWPAGAWSVGSACENRLGDDGWSGHLIVQANRWLLDLSASQYARPHKDINIQPWLMEINDAESPWLAGQDGLHMVLKPRPDITIYRKARDWRLNYRSLAAETIRALKQVEED